MVDETLILWVTLSILLFSTHEVRGHGHLWDPPQRSSMWRAGFRVPQNYDDVALNCGGFNNQWKNNRGKCGPCGDPYQGPHLHDYRGKFDTGLVGALYTEAEAITLKVHLTAFHYGYFVFHLCVDGSLYGDSLQKCFDKNVLPLISKRGYTKRFYPKKGKGMYTIRAQLPRGISCRHCVLQWVYRVGNSWGSDAEGQGLGHGPQEHFINCADIRIRPRVRQHAYDRAHWHLPSAAKTTVVPIAPSPPTTTCRPLTRATRGCTETTLNTTVVPTITSKRRKENSVHLNNLKNNHRILFAYDLNAINTNARKHRPKVNNRHGFVHKQNDYIRVRHHRHHAKQHYSIPLVSTTPDPFLHTHGEPPLTMSCHATGAWSGMLDMTQWCQTNCPLFCPPTHCACR